MKYSFDVKISEHIWEDSLGQLICLDAIIAREGTQEYYEDDIMQNGSFKIVKVMRPWEEVKKSAPTFEAKPIVVQHPDKNIDLTVKNMKEFKVGHIQNVREGKHEGVNVLIADLVFDEPDAIKKVKSGELRELSCGYFYEINTNEMKQYDIKGEHLALVEEGRAGIAKIIDGKQEIFQLHKYLTLPSKEEKDKFMSKISTEVLEGIKNYYNRNEEDEFTPEEIELTIKIIEREINSRTNANMGLSEEAKQEADGTMIKSQDSGNTILNVFMKMMESTKANNPTLKDSAIQVEVLIERFNERISGDIEVDSVGKVQFKNEIKEENFTGSDKIKDLIFEGGRYNIKTYENIKNDEKSDKNFYIGTFVLTLVPIIEKLTDEELKGGKADHLSISEIAMRHDVTEKQIRRQLKKGIEVEYEHTHDENKAREIAMDHLFEMPDYYDKLNEMENEDKANDLYIEDDDKISLEYDEEDLAWVSVSASELKKGDIISTIASIRPFEIQTIKKSGREITLHLISTDENYRKTMTLEENEVIDLLVLAETGEKITFNATEEKEE